MRLRQSAKLVTSTALSYSNIPGSLIAAAAMSCTPTRVLNDYSLDGWSSATASAFSGFVGQGLAGLP